MNRLGYTKRIVGLVLLILGVSWHLLSFLNFTVTETVIDKAFVLEPGERYVGWGQNSTFYLTRGNPILTGNVSVEGGGINFTTSAHIKGLIEHIFVDSYFNFTIDPPHGDFYWFNFDNRGGNASSHVKFVLNETLTESLTWKWMVRSMKPGTQGGWWILSLLGAFLLLPIGFILTFGSLLSKKKAHADQI